MNILNNFSYKFLDLYNRKALHLIFFALLFYIFIDTAFCMDKLNWSDYPDCAGSPTEDTVTLHNAFTQIGKELDLINLGFAEAASKVDPQQAGEVMMLKQQVATTVTPEHAQQAVLTQKEIDEILTLLRKMSATLDKLARGESYWNLITKQTLISTVDMLIKILTGGSSGGGAIAP